MQASKESTSTDSCRPFQPVADHRAFGLGCNANRHIRELLRVYGLRTSLFRLKVINALVLATREERVIGLQGVHAHIQASTSQLSLIGVREVLKRLAEVGVIALQSDRSYRFTLKAWGMLEPHFE
jgi:Fe2+ or Zn2+ uptake regulation protein